MSVVEQKTKKLTGKCNVALLLEKDESVEFIVKTSWDFHGLVGVDIKYKPKSNQDDDDDIDGNAMHGGRIVTVVAACGGS